MPRTPAVTLLPSIQCLPRQTLCRPRPPSCRWGPPLAAPARPLVGSFLLKTDLVPKVAWPSGEQSMPRPVSTGIKVARPPGEQPMPRPVSTGIKVARPSGNSPCPGQSAQGLRFCPPSASGSLEETPLLRCRMKKIYICVCIYKYMSLEDLQSFRLCSPLDSALQVLAASVSLNVQPSPRLKETVRFCVGSLSAPHHRKAVNKACPSVGSVDGPGKLASGKHLTKSSF